MECQDVRFDTEKVRSSQLDLLDGTVLTFQRRGLKVR